MRKIYIHLALVSVITAVVAPAVVWAQTWAEPNCDPATDPASCNTSAPLNVSTSAQTKAGALTITGALTGSSTLNVAGAASLSSTLSVTGTSSLGTLTVGGTSSTFNSQAIFNNAVTISGGSSAFTYSGSVANLSFTANSIEDADVSDTLTSSIFKGTGSTSNAVDLNTGEFNTTGEQWVNTTGDTMTGTLTITPSSAVDGLNITPSSTQEAIYIAGATGQPLVYLSPSASTGNGLMVAMGASSSGNGLSVSMDASSTGAALSVTSATTTTTSYPVVISSTGSAQRAVNATNAATNGYTIYAQSSGSGSVGIAGVGREQGMFGYASANNTTSKGVYGYGVYAYGGYFVTNGTGSTALYAETINTATTSGSIAIRGVGKNGYGGYFTSSGSTSTALYAANSGGGNALYLTGSGTQVAEIISTTNATDGLTISTEGIGINITTSATTADATGIVISASGGQKGIVIDATSTGIDVDTTNGYAIEASDDGIHTNGGFFGGQFFPTASTAQELSSNIYPDVVETITVGGGTSISYTNGLVYDGSDVWVASYQHSSILGSLAVQRLNGYNANDSAYYSSSYLWGYSPGAMIYAGNAMYAFSSNSVTSEYLKMYMFSDSASTSNLSTGLSVRSGVFDGADIWLGTNNRIYRWDNYTTLTSIKTGLGDIVDMLFIDGYIYALDEDNSSVYKIDYSSGSTVSTITVGSTPNDMEYDGAYIWVSNGGTGTLTRITVSDGATSTINQSPTWSDVGPLAFDGVHLWVEDSGTLYGYNISTASIDGSVSLTDTTYYDAIFDGSYVWVSNGATVDKVQVGRGYGYAMPTYPHGIIVYGEDDQYHCIYFDSTGTLSDNTGLTQCR